MATDLPPDRRNLDERETLTGMLDYYRAVLMRKAEGLTPDQLATTLGASVLTIGGLVVHMAKVEDHWFQTMISGAEPEPSTGGSDIDQSSARRREADDLVAELRAAIDRSDAVLAGVASLEQLAVRFSKLAGHHANVRWILVHMIEECARHCGHADLIREAIDGRTGD